MTGEGSPAPIEWGARPRLGVALHPEPEFLLLARGAIEDLAEFFEISPEMHWFDDASPSPARAGLLDLVRASGKPVTGHGLFMSLGAVGDEARAARRLALVARDQAAFGFARYSEHLGFTAQDGQEAVLPLPVPYSETSAEVVAARLRALPCPAVAVENGAFLAPLGDPSLEPEFLRAVCERADCGLVLDLHNAYANCLNADLSLDDWLSRVPWERVVELHLSGGSWSDPAWVRGGGTRRLDTHDGPVPEPVWAAAGRALGWAPALSGVVVEWIGLREAQLGAYEADLLRAQALLRARPSDPAPPTSEAPRALPRGPSLKLSNRVLLGALRAADPPRAVEEALAQAADPELSAAFASLDPLGLRLTSLIVKRLRFERILQGSGRFRAEFASDPATFTERFRAYDAAGPSATPWPGEEAAAFAAWT